MFLPKLDYLRYQTRFAVHIAARDLGKRLSTAALIVGLVFWVKGAEHAAGIGLVLAAYEIAGIWLYRRIADLDEDISLRYILAVWAVNWSSVIAYAWPAFVLSQEPSAALLLGGFLWLFGVFVHISNSFASLPFFNWSLMVPSFASAFVVFYLAARNEFLRGSPLEWAVTTGLMGIYILNSLDTLHKQKDTQKALEAAREEAQQRLNALEYMSRHDPLTGLLNRRAFDEDLAKLLSQSPDPSAVGVMLIDLDGFKPINDTHSHDAGDHLLREIGHRLRNVAREIGLAARLGGDEFIIAIPDLSSDNLAERLARLTLEEVEQPYLYNLQTELRVSASVGIGICRHTGAEVEALCSAADKAMYSAKTSTTEKVVLFSPTRFSSSVTPQQRLALLAAVHQGDIKPYFQPIISTEDGTLFGVHVHARWQNQPPACKPVTALNDAIREIGAESDFFAALLGELCLELRENPCDGGFVFLEVPARLLTTAAGRDLLKNKLTALSPDLRRSLVLTIGKDAFADRLAASVIAGVRGISHTGISFAMSGFGHGQMPIDALEAGLFDYIIFSPLAVAPSNVSKNAIAMQRKRTLLAGMVALVRSTQATPVIADVETKEMLTAAQEAGLFTMYGPIIASKGSLSTVLSRQIVRRPKDQAALRA